MVHCLFTQVRGEVAPPAASDQANVPVYVAPVAVSVMAKVSFRAVTELPAVTVRAEEGQATAVGALTYGV